MGGGSIQQIKAQSAETRSRLIHNHRGRVLMSVKMDESDLTPDDWVDDGLIVELATLAIRHALSAMPKNKLDVHYRVTDTRFSAFGCGDGECLVVKAELVERNPNGATCRAVFYRIHQDGLEQEQFDAHCCIADYTQTLVISPAPAENVPLDRHGASEAPSDASRAKLGVVENTFEKRRRQIFEGALKVISEQGYAATSIRKIAAAADISISTMYQYIDSKEDLLFMITSGCMDELFRFFNQELRSEGAATRKMSEAIAAYVDYISKNRRYINLVYRETRSLSAENREKIFGVERHFTALWEEIIVAGNESGEFDIEDTNLAAHIVYFICNVWALRHWAIKDIDAASVQEYLERFILRGLKGEPS